MPAIAPDMPAAANNEPKPDNIEFLRALLAAITFMVLSAVILVTGYLAWHSPRFIGIPDIQPITITGNDLFIALGEGTRHRSKLLVEKLTADGSAVISSRRAGFDASNYPVLEYKITGRNPGTDVVFYWRTSSHNHQTLFAKLHWNGNYSTAYNLKNEAEWKGQVTELGISITGDLRDEPISINQLHFRPLSIKSLLLTVWSEWNAFQGWNQSSANVFKGMPDNALISPVIVAASWCGLGIVLYTLWIFFACKTSVQSRLIHKDSPAKQETHQPPDVFNGGDLPEARLSAFKRTWDTRTVAIMFFVAWLVLDGKWQANLWRQLADTKYLFAGKTHHEQHMAADDAELYAYAKRLKEDVLPKSPVRLFMLHDEWQDRTRLRLMYYLLPHNIYNFGKYSKPNLLRDDDYILFLNPTKGLSYSVPNKTVRYNGRFPLRADLIDQTPLGTLFKSLHTNQP